MHFPLPALEAVMPVVARLPLTVLSKNRHLLGDAVYGDLLAAKLRATYDQAGKAWLFFRKKYKAWTCIT
jgi:hypothetical protein